ncbi:MAG: fimbrial biogenesis chaperone [Stenotrophomonas sp.]|uniref:fimbrial biogenesis chaperone n=1 Tax=Stenotrophomonas sp. TaxID=69392 RepID=UPI003D6CE841
MKAFFTRALLMSALVAVLCPAAHAGVVINGTRVVYPEQAREVTVQLQNTGEAPSLVQVWVDSGDARQTPDTSDAPFVLLPPIARIEAGRSQAVRLMFSGAQLPETQESLFWLNVLDVPPSPEPSAEEQNFLQVAFRSRVKLFYRPRALQGEANEAPAALLWRLDGNRLRVENPTPYHVSFSEIHVGTGTSESEIKEKSVMLAPGKSQEFPASAGVTQVRFSTINDYGGRVERTAVVGNGN